MSLDTVLQIGKALRKSENNLKYFKYVESCPKDKLQLEENLLNDFRVQCENCLEYADPCGYGFSDEIDDVFDEYYP